MANPNGGAGNTAVEGAEGGIEGRCVAGDASS